MLPLLLLPLLHPASSEQCLHPPPSPDFTNNLYAGQWFEVASTRGI